jgi:hypothetical protein
LENKIRIELFADDTTLYLSDSNFDRLVLRINAEFKKITDFFRSHKLALHPEKTKFIVFTNSSEVRNRQVIINLDFNNDNDVIKCPALIRPLSRVCATDSVPAVKFLGVFIDPFLNFKYHINCIDS